MKSGRHRPCLPPVVDATTTEAFACLRSGGIGQQHRRGPDGRHPLGLPASTALPLSGGRGVKVTALIRDWVEQQLADNTDDQRVVSVAELRRLIAHAS